VPDSPCPILQTCTLFPAVRRFCNRKKMKRQGGADWKTAPSLLTLSHLPLSPSLGRGASTPRQTLQEARHVSRASDTLQTPLLVCWPRLRSLHIIIFFFK
jgi:hypothetical protein